MSPVSKAAQRSLRDTTPMRMSAERDTPVHLLTDQQLIAAYRGGKAYIRELYTQLLEQRTEAAELNIRENKAEARFHRAQANCWRAISKLHGAIAAFAKEVLKTKVEHFIPFVKAKADVAAKRKMDAARQKVDEAEAARDTALQNLQRATQEFADAGGELKRTTDGLTKAQARVEDVAREIKRRKLPVRE